MKGTKAKPEKEIRISWCTCYRVNQVLYLAPSPFLWFRYRRTQVYSQDFSALCRQK